MNLLKGINNNEQFNLDDTKIYIVNDNAKEILHMKSNQYLFFKGELNCAQSGIDPPRRNCVMYLEPGFITFIDEETEDTAESLFGYLKNPFIHKKYREVNENFLPKINVVKNEVDHGNLVNRIEDLKPTYQDFLDYYASTPRSVQLQYKKYMLASANPLNEILLPIVPQILNIIRQNDESKWSERKTDEALYIYLEEISTQFIKQGFNSQYQKLNFDGFKKFLDEIIHGKKETEQGGSEMSDESYENERIIFYTEYQDLEYDMRQWGVDEELLLQLIKNIEDFEKGKEIYFEKVNILNRQKQISNFSSKACLGTVTWFLFNIGYNLMQFQYSDIPETIYVNKFRLLEYCRKNFGKNLRKINARFVRKESNNDLPNIYSKEEKPKSKATFKLHRKDSDKSSSDGDDKSNSNNRTRDEKIDDKLPKMITGEIYLTDDIGLNHLERYRVQNDIGELRVKFDYNYYITINTKKGDKRLTIIAYVDILTDMLIKWIQYESSQFENFLENKPILNSPSTTTINGFTIPNLVISA
jgi:hypothetical protein